MALDFLRRAIYGETLDETYETTHSRLSAPRSVSEDEWLDYDNRFYNDLSGGYKLLETSSTDMAKIEELLQVEPDFFASP